jgi:hypothetical protein
MVFKKKRKNRRFARDHVLDVKMRVQHTRALRVRFAAATFTILLTLTVAGLALWRGSEWALEHWIYKNPAFNIHKVDVQTDGVIPLHQIRNWAGVKEGQNIWTVDLFRVRRDLETQPLIQSASVERVLPHTLRLRVVEREPIAQITGFYSPTPNVLRAVTYYLDDAGYVMPPLSAFDPSYPVAVAPESLPVLTGIMGTEMRPGKRVESAQIHAALQLVAAFSNSPMAGMVDLKKIDLSEPQVLHVTTFQGNDVTFPLHGLPKQLQRWRSVHDYAAQERKVIASLDLSVSNNIPARWQEEPVIVPVRPKPQHPSRYRKKNV